jgi:hypothetical protein
VSVVQAKSIGVSGRNCETVKHGGGISLTTDDNMVAVLGVVCEVRPVIATQVTAEDSLVQFDISGIGVRLTESSVATFDDHAISQLERGFAVARPLFPRS